MAKNIKTKPTKTIRSKAKPKTKTKAKSTVVSGSFIKSGLKLSKLRLSVFALIVAAIGVAGLLYSYAATAPSVTIEAKSLTYTKAVKYPETTYMSLYSNDVATGSFTTDFDSVQLSLTARGDYCQAWPVLTVKVDGVTVMNQSIDSTTMKTYTAKASIKKGTHTIQVDYQNDFRSTSCDRNAYLQRLIVTGATPIESTAPEYTTVAASTFTYDKPPYIENGTVLLFTNNTGKTTLRLPTAATAISLYAGGTDCSGRAAFTLYVDGKIVMQKTTTSGTATEYKQAVSLTAGDHAVSVVYANDTQTRKCDRNLLLTKLVATRVASTVPEPTPVPTSPESPTPTPAPAPAPAPTSAKLMWAPPAGWENYTVMNVPEYGHYAPTLNKDTDYRFVLPSKPKHGSIQLYGGRNIVIIGGEIINDEKDFYTGSVRAIHIVDRDAPVGRIVHIEGVKYYGSVDGTVPVVKQDGISASAPNTILQVQNTSWLNLRGQSTSFAKDSSGRIFTSDGKGYMDSNITVLGDATYKARIADGSIKFWKNEHSDIIQPFGGVKALRVDRLTGSTNGQGLFLRPDSGSSATSNKMGSIDLHNINITAQSTAQASAGEMLWFTNTNSADVFCQAGKPITMSNFYISAGSTGKSLNDLVWPKTNNNQTVNCPAVTTDAGKSMSWPKLGTVGSVQFGPPPAGDFVPENLPGLNYKSPGYN